MEKFYDDNGLKFKCTNCKACCTLDGGAVILSSSDLSQLAKYVDLTEEQFIKVYCRWLENSDGKQYLCLKDKNKSQCVFWDCEHGCQVYEGRPVQCRTYPFWTKILKTRNSWEKEKSFCPGINCGETHSKSEIESELSKYEENKTKRIIRQSENYASFS